MRGVEEVEVVVRGVEEVRGARSDEWDLEPPHPRDQGRRGGGVHPSRRGHIMEWMVMSKDIWGHVADGWLAGCGGPGTLISLVRRTTTHRRPRALLDRPSMVPYSPPRSDEQQHTTGPRTHPMDYNKPQDRGPI